MKLLLFLFSAAVAFAGTTVQRTTAGLYISENFSNATGWTASAGFTTPAAPGGVIFTQLPIVTLNRTIGGVDEAGCREAHMFIEGDYRDITEPRHLFYGAAPAGLPWRPNLANSTDGALTFTKLGGWGPGLSDGASGTYAARDMLYVSKRGSTYVLHAMIANSAFGGGIPGSPYWSDIWTATNLTNWTTNSFTFAGHGVDLSGSGFDQGSAYASCVVPDGGNYKIFWNASNVNFTLLNVGVSTASVYSGPYTKTAGPILNDSSQSRENPKVFFDNVLQKWVMFMNSAISAGFTDIGQYWLSDDLNDWSTAPLMTMQRICPNDAQIAVGLVSPYYTINDAPIVTPDGFMPVTWDNNPQGSTGTDVHLGRRIVSGVWEPTAKALQYPTGLGSTVNTYRKSLTHSDFSAEWAVIFEETVGTSFSAFDYRIQGGGDSYRVVLTVGAGLKLQKSSGGTYSDLATSSGTLLGIQDFTHRIRVVVVGNLHTLFLDGEQQVAFTDSSSPFTSGVTIGFAGKAIKHKVRSFHIRAADTITVSGLTVGQVVTLRAPGTPPVATQTASSSTVTFTGLTHFPLESVQVDAQNNVISGGVWGGDSFSAISASTGRSPVSPPRRL